MQPSAWSECHRSRSHEVEGQRHSTCHPCPTLALRPRAKRGMKRRKGKGWEGVRKVCGVGWKQPWPLNVTCFCCTATGPTECANAGCYMLGCERWKWGRSVCNSHVLSPWWELLLEVHRESRVRVTVMQRLMEISCPDSVLVWGAGGPGGTHYGHCSDAKALSRCFTKQITTEKQGVAKTTVAALHLSKIKTFSKGCLKHCVVLVIIGSYKYTSVTAQQVL